MIDIQNISKGLALGPDDIWYAETAASISYPDAGNEMCFEIEDRSFWFKHRIKCILKAIRRFPPKGAIFDIGGGNGYVSAAIMDNGFEAVLIEPGIYGAKIARAERKIPQVVCATIKGAKFLPNSLPAAGIFDVLEHIEDDRDFLRRLFQLLVPSGRLYITVPSGRFLWSNEDIAAGHYRRYSLRTLAARLEETGFAIEYMTYFFGFLPVPILIFRTLPARIGLRRSRKSKRVKKEHLLGKSTLTRVAATLLAREIEKIHNGKAMSFGSSCLAVASKLS